MPQDIFGTNTDPTTGQSYSATGGFHHVTSLPSWMPTQGANEAQLMEQYRGTNAAYDTNPYDVASQRLQANLLTSSLNAGTNAARDYSNRARQSGASGMGAGLVKAEAQVGARATAGGMELERQRFDASQREAAATHATQIATTLGQLRDSYLRSLVTYATSEDATNAQYQTAANARRDASGRGGSDLHYTTGTGLGRGSSEFSFGSNQEATNFFQQNQGTQTAFGYVPPSWHG